MPGARVGVQVAADRQSVGVEIGPVEGPPGPVALSLEQLTKLIDLLGQARMQMLEGQRLEPLEGATVKTISNPLWFVQVARIDGSVLAFNHPAYGPVAFEILRDDVAKMVQILSAHLALPAGAQGKPS